MNHTPEPRNWEHRIPPPRCTWCVNSHVANIACSCTEPCESGWCAAPGDDPFTVNFL